jgi:protocatechuate 3,4-dioxygenase beta subunit
MWKCLPAVLAATAMHAAIIRGVVVENQSGKPLARTLVTVQPVRGSAGPTLATRTNLYGAFEFPPVPAGVYLISAARGGFAPAQYGQKTFRSAGMPVFVEDTAVAFLDIRLRRFGAISGTIEDENLVGLPEVEAVAYRNTRPPKLAARAKADDRGVFRISGLEPGVYLVRTVSKQFEDGGYLPTFFKETATMEQAHTVEVMLDEQADHINVKPTPGRLLNIGGTVRNGPATVTLVSDMGRENMTVSGPFRFNPVAPGYYELFAQTQDLRADYLSFRMDLDKTDFVLEPRRFDPVVLSFRGKDGQTVPPTAVQVLARRKDLAGEGEPQSMNIASGSVILAPGRWDIALVPNASWYVNRFSASGTGVLPTAHPEGWNEFLVRGKNDGVFFSLSPSPGAVHGTVTGSNHDPVPGALVFLETMSVDPRQRLLDIRSNQTDMRGHYQFIGLPPGSYRLLGTFEYQTVDSAVMEAANARGVTVEEGRDLAQDLDLYIIR